MLCRFSVAGVLGGQTIERQQETTVITPCNHLRDADSDVADAGLDGSDEFVRCRDVGVLEEALTTQ